jgi:hypothetical protein
VAVAIAVLAAVTLLPPAGQRFRAVVPGSGCPAAPLFQLDDEEASIVHLTLKN